MMIKHPPWVEVLLSLRFMQLLLFSMGSLLLQAVFHQSVLLGLVINLLLLNVLVVTLSASGARRSIRYLLVGLWIASLVTRFLAPAGFELEFFILSKCIGSILLGLCVGSMMHVMFFSQRVTADTLFAGVVIYVLIAILFAQLYSITEAFSPGSFSYPPEMPLENGRLRDIAYNYFSFVTIATLGYGDIAPRHPVAQMLSSIEAVIGQFYVAIVVARLVTLYAVAKQELAE